MDALKVVITGASGFLGGYVLTLLSKYEDVETIAVTRKNISGWCTISDYSESPVGDILIHLAENNDRAHVAKFGKAYEIEALETITALLSIGYHRVVYASSSVLYGDKDAHPHIPNDPIQINDTYTRVKQQSEFAVLRTHGGIVVRLANVYGPGMANNNVMSTILRQIPGEGGLEVMNTSPIRDFIWVEDVAEGIVALALSNFIRDSKRMLFNLGTSVGTSIGALAELALSIAEQPDRPVYSISPLNRQSTLILDFSATTSACGWQPKTTLRQGLTQILQTS